MLVLHWNNNFICKFEWNVKNKQFCSVFAPSITNAVAVPNWGGNERSEIVLAFYIIILINFRADDGKPQKTGLKKLVCSVQPVVGQNLFDALEKIHGKEKGKLTAYKTFLKLFFSPRGNQHNFEDSGVRNDELLHRTIVQWSQNVHILLPGKQGIFEI